MADETRPSFKHTVAKKALSPLVATAATAITTYLMRKAAEAWQETVQPKLDEKGGAEAVVREGRESEPAVADDRDEERRKREQRRRQRRKALEQSGSS
jgi:hypothetical protein